MILWDLTKTEEESWQDLSKGHRSILKKYLNISDCHYINFFEAALDFKQFAEMMLTIGEFSKSYLKYFYALFQQNHLEIVHLIYHEKIVGMAVFLKYHNTVQYYAASRFTEEAIPVHHLLVWKAHQKYRDEGFQYMDLGVFSYHAHLNYLPSNKAKGVSMFKRGFGGKVLPFLLGEKYFNRTYFEVEYQQRIAKYGETIE